ncbi:hypothetical protein LINPERHAP1_LOCUS36712 [Linum perenne]
MVDLNSGRIKMTWLWEKFAYREPLEMTILIRYISIVAPTFWTSSIVVSLSITQGRMLNSSSPFA